MDNFIVFVAFLQEMDFFGQYAFAIAFQTCGINAYVTVYDQYIPGFWFSRPIFYSVFLLRSALLLSFETADWCIAAIWSNFCCRE